MVVTPSILMVWLLGALLAVNIGLFDGQAGLGWLHAKLVLVFILSGYHGWAVGYSKKLARGEARLTDRQRSEEHTSELQSLMRISYAVFCLTKNNNIKHNLSEHTT